MSFIELFNIPDIVTDKTKILQALKLTQLIVIYYLFILLVLYPGFRIIAHFGNLYEVMDNWKVIVLFATCYVIAIIIARKLNNKLKEKAKIEQERLNELKKKAIREKILRLIKTYFSATTTNIDEISDIVMKELVDLFNSEKYLLPTAIVLNNLKREFSKLILWAFAVYFGLLTILVRLDKDTSIFIPNEKNILFGFAIYITVTSLISATKLDLYSILSGIAKGKYQKMKKLIFSVLTLIAPYSLFEFLVPSIPTLMKYTYLLPYKDSKINGIPNECKNKKRYNSKCTFFRFAEKLISNYIVYPITKSSKGGIEQLTDYKRVVHNLDIMMNEIIPSSLTVIKNTYVVIDEKHDKISILMLSLQKPSVTIHSDKNNISEEEGEHKTLKAKRIQEEGTYFASIIELGLGGSIVWDILLELSNPH